jgi:hypothetical protein
LHHGPRKPAREGAREDAKGHERSEEEEQRSASPPIKIRHQLTFSLQQSGTEFQRTKEAQADIMRAKQAAGAVPICWRTEGRWFANVGAAAAKKAAEGGAEASGTKK